MATESMPKFEVPAEMRNLAEQSVAAARQAFDGFMSAAQKTISALETQATSAQSGARDVSKKALAFAEMNVASSFEFAQRLVRAKDPQEMLKLQAEFIETQMKTLAEQAKDLGETASKAAEKRSR
jgi:phasin